MDRFTSTELALASALTPRNFALLHDEGLAPAPFSRARGKSSHRLYDTAGVLQSALIGAINKGGAEPILAARLATVVAEEFISSYGKLFSNLQAYLHKPLNPKAPYWPWEEEPETVALFTRTGDDFWLHHLLITRTKSYRPGLAIIGDFILEIADRKYVFTDALESKIRFFSPVSHEGTEGSPSYRINGWERGRDAEVTNISHELASFNFTSDPIARAQYKKIETEFVKARKNSIGLLRVNVSLAIRNALDAIHEHRARSGKSIH